MTYSWDRRKAAKAFADRELAFEDACIVLEDEGTLVVEDDRADYGETRLIAVGPLDGRLMVIVYTERKHSIHIISMRKANRREKARYQKQLGSARRDEG